MTLVVLAHSPAFSRVLPGLTPWIFLFHVPAFFFVSGYLLRPGANLLPRLAGRILLPFLLAGIGLALAKVLLRGEEAPAALAGVLWGTGPTLPSSQLWFLPTLFLTLCASAPAARLLLERGAGTAGLLALGAALAGAGWIGLHLPAPPVEALRRPGVGGPTGWPWGLDLLPIAMFFCLAGYAARRFLPRPPPLWLLPAGLAATAAGAVAGVRVDMNLRLMEPLPLALAAGLAGSVALLAAGRLFAGAPARVFEEIGRRSMAILIFHVAFQNAAVSALSQAPAVALLAGALAGVGGPIALSWGYERLAGYGKR